MIKIDPIASTWLSEHPTIAIVRMESAGAFEVPGDYFDTFWLPVLGPTATLAMRRIASLLTNANQSGTWLPLEPFAGSLGVKGTARNSPIVKALHRLIGFKLAAIDYDHDLLAFATNVGYISARGYAGLPTYLKVQHQNLMIKETV